MLGFLLGEHKEVFVNENTRQYHSEIQDGGGQTGNTCMHSRIHGIFKFLYMIATELERLNPCFLVR